MVLSSQTLRSVPLPIRAAAAAAAGFSAIGAHHEDIEALGIAAESTKGLRDAIEAEGVMVVEVGFLNRWAGPERAAVAERNALFSLAGALGADRVNVGLYSGPGQARIVERFRALCRAAAQAGLRVSLEFFPYGPIPNAATALEIVAGAGDENADILFDAWHWHRGGGDMSVPGKIPPGMIGSLQLSDAAALAAADLGEESRHSRLLPGAGTINLVGLLQSLTAAGHHPPIAVEVLSDDLGAKGPQQAAFLAAAASRRLLRLANWRE